MSFDRYSTGAAVLVYLVSVVLIATVLGPQPIDLFLALAVTLWCYRH